MAVLGSSRHGYWNYQLQALAVRLRTPRGAILPLAMQDAA
jgi:hypothetical protein